MRYHFTLICNIYPSTIFKTLLQLIEPVPFLHQDSPTATLQTLVCFFLQSVFGESNTQKTEASPFTRSEPL